MPRTRTTALLLGVLACAFAGSAFAEGDTLSYDHARLYTVSEETLWRAVVETADELGLVADFADDAVGLYNTRWMPLGGRRAPEGVPQVDVAEGVPAREFQLHVLVSVYARPGRVRVDSVLRGGERRDEVVVFNEGSIEAWFLEALEARLGEEGSALPSRYRSRRALSSSLADSSRYDPCAARVGAVKPGQSARQDIPNVTIPDLLPFTRLDPVPRDLRRGRKETFTIALTVLEDGAVSRVRWGEDAPEEELARYAEGAISLWRFLPGKKRGCPIETRTTTTVELVRTRGGR